MSSKITIDTRGLKCPLPVLKLEKQLVNCTKKSKITLLTDDPVAIIDIPLFCQQNEHICTMEKNGDIFEFLIIV